MADTAAPPAPSTTAPAAPATPGASSLVGATPSASPTPSSDAVASLGHAPPIEFTYNLILPDNAVLPPEAIERTTAIARELGLSQDAAQKVLESMNQEGAQLVDTRVNAVIEAHKPGGSEWAKQAAEWKRASLEDTSLGKTLEEREAAIQRGVQVIDKFAQAHPTKGQALRKFLNDSGFGNNPKVVGFFAWLGKSAGEPQTLEGGGTQPQTVDQKKLWFPNTYQEKDSAA